MEKTTGNGKKWSKEDLHDALTPKGLMEAYHSVLKDDKHTPHSEIQTAMSEKLNHLGEEEKSFQFAILAGQTKNTENSQKQTDQTEVVMQNVVDEFSSLPSELQAVLFKHAEELHGLPRQIHEALKPFGRSLQGVDVAAESIQKSARSMSESASVIRRASNQTHQR